VELRGSVEADLIGLVRVPTGALVGEAGLGVAAVPVEDVADRGATEIDVVLVVVALALRAEQADDELVGAAEGLVVAVQDRVQRVLGIAAVVVGG
jgi:deoxyribose-phosphate aldolase